ncbi:hypothetical protein PPERSA_06439 [Pseudocohnilembus persalinus]|uniref:Uncharacterized protein n=1 Tax=Pseudocohnilembus persalinus TaxID=266149 RepID=A0A0V0QSD2_PSEPJ|nr:hypothetical protein PPERSA_06439 [Pseudocohnilembus persalinus]|eukprot:KRX04805.1 hypothetical protein PPERSA_06439 [Pseudocohnilembus persalinus]
MQESAFGQYIYYRNFHTVMKAKMYFLYTEYIVHMKSFKLQLEQAKQKKGCNTTKFLNEQLLYEILKKYTTLTPTCYICIFHCTQEKNSKLSQTKTSFLGQTLQPINEDKKQSSSQSQQSQQNLQKTIQNSQSLENHLGYFRRLQNIRASNLQRVGKYSIYYSNSQSLSREDVLKNQQKMFEYFEDLKSSIDFYTTRSKQDRESQRLIEFNFSRLNQKWYFASFLVRMTKNQQQQEEYRKKYMEFFNFLQNTWNYTSLATFDVDALKILEINQQ